MFKYNSSFEPGVINYYFYRTIDDKEERVESTEVAKMVRNANLWATATVVAIVGVSLAENFAPFAGGVANDIASFLAALTMGAKCFGY